MFSYRLKLWFTLMMMVVSFLGTIMSPSWLMIWVFLELNLMSIMPLLSMSLIYYFVIQSLAGIVFLLGSINNLVVLLIFSIMIKLALFPFSFWMPKVIFNSDWLGGALLSSSSKIIPLYVMTNFLTMELIFFFFTTVLWGGIYGCFQTNFKKILACSSVSHTGWMATLLSLKIKNNLIYFLTYFPLVSLLFFLSKSSKFIYWETSNQNKLVILTILLILSGLPPFSGAWVKILTFFSLSISISIFSMMFFIASALNLFFYFKLMMGFINKSLNFSFKHLILSFMLMMPQFVLYIDNNLSLELKLV